LLSGHVTLLSLRFFFDVVYINKEAHLYFSFKPCYPSFLRVSILVVVHTKVDCSHKPTQVFSVYFVLTHTLYGSFAKGHSSKGYSKSSTLNCEVFIMSTVKKKIHLVNICCTNQFLQVFVHPCNSIHVRSPDHSHSNVNSIHSCVHYYLEATKSRSLSMPMQGDHFHRCLSLVSQTREKHTN
jgi:hypothetical protein